MIQINARIKNMERSTKEIFEALVDEGEALKKNKESLRQQGPLSAALRAAGMSSTSYSPLDRKETVKQASVPLKVEPAVGPVVGPDERRVRR